MNVTPLYSPTREEPASDAGRRLEQAPIRPAPRDTAAGASLGRRLGYKVWPFLPRLARRLAFSLVAQRVTLGACAVIGDSRGRVLVAHHTYRGRGWGLPGGLVGKHEAPHAALERELREELGTESRIGSLLDSEVENGHLTLYYAATITGLPCPDGVEIDRFRFVTPAELAALVGTPSPGWLARVWERQAS
ncbi:MAG TPA: NUDIX hydrolase [Chloroflexota bacterium]|jgi:8-oxo-dGTP pyrophosphatase MutT (NUDIX family)